MHWPIYIIMETAVYACPVCVRARARVCVYLGLMNYDEENLAVRFGTSEADTDFVCNLMANLCDSFSCICFLEIVLEL